MKANRFFKKIIDKIRLLPRKDRESYLLLYSILGFVPGNIKLYGMAMTHSSFSPSGKKLSCNERLEFLGDAVLSSVTADFLYSKFSGEREGFLTRSRSNLVCRERLNELALHIGLDKYLQACGLPQQQHNSNVYGNALEALVGAIYLDKGYKHCRRFLLDRVFSQLTDIESVAKSDKNYKSRLIEWGQKQHRDVEFRIAKEELRKEGAFFVSEALVGGEVFGVGEGFSKRESQQKAAREALVKLEVK